MKSLNDQFNESHRWAFTFLLKDMDKPVPLNSVIDWLNERSISFRFEQQWVTSAGDTFTVIDLFTSKDYALLFKLTWGEYEANVS